MKKIKLNNLTARRLVVEYSDTRTEIAPSEKLTLQVNSGDKLRIFALHKYSSKFLIGQYLSKEELRSAWIFGPALCLDFDAFVEISNYAYNIDITSEKYHFMIFTIFNVLLFNGEKGDYYNYHRNVDKRKFNLFSFLCLLPITAIAAILIITAAYGLIYDFSAFSVFLAAVCILVNWLAVSMIKSVNRFKKFDKNSAKLLEESKRIKIYKCVNWLIKYVEIN